MQRFSIINTKLYKPVIKDHYIVRKEIIEQLERNRKNPLTLVVAPTGYGKSIAISEWLDRIKARYCWLSLDEEFNDVRTFIIYLTFAIRKVYPGALSLLQDLVLGSEMPQPKELTSLLINGIDETDQELIIVLDDYHSINNRHIHEIIYSLIRNIQPNLRLVIISRRDPALKLNLLKTFGEVTELRMTDLSFKLDEIKALAEKNLNIPIDEKTAMLLLDKTEGWVVGLRMALIYIAKHKDIKKSVKELEVDQSYYRQYLLEVVLLQQPEPVRELLLTASIPERFSWDFLKYISGRNYETEPDQDKALFDQFLSSTLFIIPLDEEGRWYRFHQLVRDMLRNQLARSYDDREIRKLFAKAGEWFESQQLIDEAIRYAVKAEDYVKAVHIIEKNRLLKFSQEQWWVVRKWMQLIPENIVQEHTILLLTKLWLNEEEHRYEDLINNIQILEQRLSDRLDNRYLGELLFHKGYLNVLVLTNPKEAVEQLVRSESLCPDRGEIGRRREHMLVMALQMNGNRNRALQLIREGLSHPENPDQFKEALLAAETVVHLLSGELEQAISSAYKDLSMKGKRDSNLSSFWINFLLSNALFQCYKLKQAQSVFEGLVAYKDVLYPMIALHVLIGYCLTTFMVGDFEASEKGLKELDSYAKSSGSDSFNLMAYSCKARIHLLKGENDPALEWSGSYVKEPQIAELQFFIEVPAITKARVGITCGNDQLVQNAVNDLNELLVKVRSVNNNFQMVDIYVLLAIGYFKSGNRRSAKKSLINALIIAEKNGFIRPFIEPGRIVDNLFRSLSIDRDHEYFVKILRKHWPREFHEIIPQKVSTQHFGANGENALTKREKEILLALAEGLRNKEIAEKLFLSPNSIRKYLYEIYQKLEVNNRTMAAKKAKELDLI